MKTGIQKQATAALDILRGVADIIQEAGEIPSGHLYGALMAKGMSLETYHQLIALLKHSGLIEEDPSCLLRWVGPEIQESEAVQ